MDYVTWPRSTARVSRLGFGAMGLCNCFEPLEEQDHIRSVLHALERGVTFIDTARGYGASEEILGKALKQWGGPRPFIATKVESLGKDNTRWAVPPPVDETFPRGHVTKNAETSLRLLGVDRLDLLQLHLYWPHWGTRGHWMDELQALRERGLVGSIGVSAPDHRGDVTLPLVASGLIDSVQTIINVFDPLAFDALVPVAQQHGVAIIARCILDEGGLTGAVDEATSFRDGDFRKSYFEAVPRAMYVARLRRLREYVPQHGKTLAALAIKYVLAHPGVTTAITSMHVRRFADENIDAANEPPLAPDVFQRINRHERWIRNFYESKYWS